MNRLFWIRHGENRANLTKEFSSRRVDYSLTEKGHLQASQTADYFQNVDIDSIFSSPLKRAVETAEIIALRKNLPVVQLEGLREIDVGDLELAPPTAEIWAEHNKILMAWMSGDWDAGFPGGENYHMLLQRVREALHTMLDGMSDKTVLAVGHGGTLITTVGELCAGDNLAWIFQKGIENCAITELEVGLIAGQLRGKLVRWADVSHLHGYAAELVSGSPQEGELP